MNLTDEVAAKTEVTERQTADAGAGSDDVLRKFDERFRATLKDFQRGSDQRQQPVEDLRISDDELNERLGDLQRPSPQRKFAEDVQNLLSQIGHHLDYETSQRTTINRRLLAIEDEVKKRGPRGFARYLIAVCIGAAGVIAWQSYGAATKEVIATRAPELGWSPETKQMIASWVQDLGLVKPPAGQESDAAQLSVQTPQSTPVGLAAAGSGAPSSGAPSSAAPSSVAPSSVASSSATPQTATPAAIDLQTIQQMEADIAAARQTVEAQLAAVRQTIEQLAAGQDQMAGEITKLQAADQEILEKIPAPPPPPRIAAPAHKPKPIVPPARTLLPPHP
jgi:hypothetical protein